MVLSAWDFANTRTDRPTDRPTNQPTKWFHAKVQCTLYSITVNLYLCNVKLPHCYTSTHDSNQMASVKHIPLPNHNEISTMSLVAGSKRLKFSAVPQSAFPTTQSLFTLMDYGKYPDYAPDHIQNLINSSLAHNTSISHISFKKSNHNLRCPVNKQSKKQQ